PVSGTGTWSVITGSGGTIANPSSPTSNFTGTGGTTYTLRWSISNACANSTDDVTIQMITPPTVAAAGPDQNVCSGTVNLAGNTPTSGTGAWTIVSGAGGSITTPSSATSSFTGVAGTMYVLRWTISSPGCTPTSDEVNIQINSLPGGTGTINGITSLCPGVTATYTISGITNATDYQWQLSDGFELVSATGPSANIRAVSGAGGVIQVVGQNSCGTGGTAQHAVNILPPPDVTIVSPSETFVNEVISVSFTTTSNITTQTWSFGDNGSANTPSADHTYTGGGDFTIQLDVVDSKECINSVSKTIRVNAEAELSNSSIKNVITANGDEKNAYLYIERIERFPESEVILLDRIGVEVFRQKNYQNDWDLRKGEDYLPAGNYICVVRYNGKIYSRSVTVIKGK
ncbi:MAG: gliding motility-associated C-terminal domain-containing protein, partial [Bacteroidota bacterium]